MVTPARAFLSWSTIDPRAEPLVRCFKAWLNSMFDGRVQFFFSKEIDPGENSIPRVYRALNDADLGFILLSQRTARSPWVIYESGCLNPSLRAGKVFPLLFDISPEELRRICPPLAEFQGVSLRNRDDMRRLVTTVGRKIGLGTVEELQLLDRFSVNYPALERAIDESVDSVPLLPDRFAGTIAYNNNINGSKNFVIPEIFSQFDEELLLVGINLSFLLNLESGAENFRALLDALLADRRRHVKILISDLWDRQLLHTYDRIVFGAGTQEFSGIRKTFAGRGTTSKFDDVVREHCRAEYSRICRQLVVKKIKLLSDTFWFVDPGDSGSMLFSLMTTATGRDRPVYYISQVDSPELYSKYFDVCRAAFDLSADVLWPPR